MDPRHSAIVPELNFLIAKYLSGDSFGHLSDAFKRELERNKQIPPRIDWEGNLHDQTFEEWESKYPHISPEHLLKICSRIGPILEKDIPPCVHGELSLLAAGKQSLLRTQQDLLPQIGIHSYTARIGGKPLLEPFGTSFLYSIVRVLQGRELSGPMSRRQAITTKFYEKMKLYRHTLGHLSSVYCVLYDKTGKYVITGADDLLVKVWSTIDGRLLATFRGASQEIMDIAVNANNTLLAAGSVDKIIRVWCFQTMSPVAVLSGHSGMITSVNFCPIRCHNSYYLVSTSTDGSVCFWSYTKNDNERATFIPKPIQYHEKMRPGQAQMICASFSPGGAFVAAGSADHHVRVYAMIGEEGPRRILEVEAHNDTVDSIQWAHSGLKFISGSKDGTANIWRFEQQNWHNTRLNMTTRLPGETVSDEDSNKKPKVTMVSWDVSDEWVITAVNDSSLKVWNSKSGELVKVLRGHKDDVFVLESHPTDSRIILSAGHDGQLIIWDILESEPISCFQNFIHGQGNGAVFDAKWSPDGTMFAATDSHGHLLMYGFGEPVDKKKVPKELFFHTDFRPLIRDANNYVLDEQTQTAPHLMPPPFLVDVDGNPYPPALQRLVPGRENCRGEQLVPNIAVGASGMQEVIEGIPEQHEVPRSNIDRMIEALAQRQRINAEGEEQPRAADGGDYEEEEMPVRQMMAALAFERRGNDEEMPVRQIAQSPRGNRGLRRDGDVEGVRQSSGNWQRDNTTPWNKPILVKPLHSAIVEQNMKNLYAMANAEMDNWERELKRKPAAVPTAAVGSPNGKLANKRRMRATHGYRTRAARGEEQEEEDFENESSGDSGNSSSNDSSANEEDMCSESSDSDSSSEYSDWIADQGMSLEPPKRSKRKPVKKRSPSPPSDTDRRRSQRPKKKPPSIGSMSNGMDEVPEAFRPSEWLTAVIPRKAPYYPQMGDEIVYFREGHQLYITAVKNKKVYELGKNSEPWTKMDLKSYEFVKVVGIRYEIRPPRLCCLKLAITDEDGKLTGKNFTIKYHDMADVLDFLVLRQTYDIALNRNWSEGDRFRCMIDDGWWIGQITSIEPFSEDALESYFMCFKVRWDNGEVERMSPWDLEPIDMDRLPDVEGGAVPVLPNEIQATLYQPKPEEWPMGDREATCRRIIRGFDEVMTLAIAEPFIAPVDLNVYPDYACTIEYPIDLSTIKARFENHFYRRITSAQFDVRYLAANAEQFNRAHSPIVKQARIITELCLKLVKESIDVKAFYHQLVDTYDSTDTEVDVEEMDTNQPSTSSNRTRSGKKARSHPAFSQEWTVACRQLLELLWACEDSAPFREPVDAIDHSDYYQIIDTPMDLRTVKEDLLGGNYDTPLEFSKDVKLIFTNSKNYNTNKRSKIYGMTVRMSCLFEEHMKKILSSYKSAKRRKPAANSRKKKPSPKPKKSNKPRLTNGAGPSKVATSSSEDEEEVNVKDEEDYDEVESNKALTNGYEDEDEPGPSRLTNGYAKALRSSGSLPRQRETRKQLPTRATRSAQNMRNSSDSEVSSESEESNSSDSDVPRQARPPLRGKRALSSDGENDDSEDSYKPSARGKQTRRNRAKNSRRATNHNVAKSPAKKIKEESSDNDEESEQSQHEEFEAIEEEEVLDEAQFQVVEKLETPAETSDTEEEALINRNSARLRKPVPRLDASSPGKDSSDEEKSGEENSSENDNSESEGVGEGEAQLAEENQGSEYTESEEESDCGVALKKTARRSTRNNTVDGDLANLNSGSNSTQLRKRKRQRYNEDSDESSETSATTPVRNRRQVKRQSYAEDSDESQQGPAICISRSGRVCKMTPRARAYLKTTP